MNKYGLIFPILGIGLIGYWLWTTTTQVEGDSIQSMINARTKYGYLGLIGVACFWVNPILNWIKSGVNVNLSAIISIIKEQVFPSYGRAIPLWGQFLRFIGGGLFVYFMLTSVTIVNDELNFESKNFFLIFLGAVLFFVSPFLFPKQDK